MRSGYQEARQQAAFDERQDRGRVLLTGVDAKAFLHALLTNDIESLAPGTGCYAALLTPQGRMITDMDVLADASVPPQVLLVVPSDVAGPLAARLDKLIFTEEVAVADVSASTTHFSVAGPAAARAVDSALKGLGYDAVASLLTKPFHNVRLSGASEDGLVWRTDELGLDGPAGFDLCVGSKHADVVRRQLHAHAAPLSPEARTILRLEAGRPEFHIDMTEDTIPLEANLLERAISTTKGCYVGQEVIIRVLHRGGGRVAKRLVQLRFDGREEAVPAAGDTLSEGDREIGRVTSAAWSPRDKTPIGLGYVHRDFARAGVALSVSSGGTATITAA
ncbi:MAG: glycine cleavage T C-terminal barrel domain-containing protein [Vicinamibacterales bacterium]